MIRCVWSYDFVEAQTHDEPQVQAHDVDRRVFWLSPFAGRQRSIDRALGFCYGLRFIAARSGPQSLSLIFAGEAFPREPAFRPRLLCGVGSVRSTKLTLYKSRLIVWCLTDGCPHLEIKSP